MFPRLSAVCATLVAVFISLTTPPPALDFVALVVAAGPAEVGVHVSPGGHGAVAGCAVGVQTSPVGQGAVATGVAGVQTSPVGHGAVATGVAGVQISPAGQGDAIALVAEKIKADTIINNDVQYFIVTSHLF